MEDEHLHLLIDEEIYLVDSNKLSVESEQSTVDSRQSTVESDAKIDPIEKVGIAFIHTSHEPEELDLLDKIVGACEIDSSEFRILKEGESVTYERAVIFTNSADQFYIPQETDEGKILYSKPLETLINSKEEKGKLWRALKSFISQ